MRRGSRHGSQNSSAVAERPGVSWTVMTADRWDSWPSRASQDYFEKAMRAHTKVRGVTKVSPSRWDLTLTDGTTVEVFITDVYTFSASDYALLRAQYPNVRCVVQASNWNYFSTQASEEADADDVLT